MKQAMYERHMVRKYLDKPIPQECREKIEQHTRMLNDEYGVDISLVLDNTEAFNAAIKLILAKGVRNYFILAGPESADLNERLGMAGADLMLYCQTLGLNTWWVGGTFNRMKMEEKAKGEKVIGVIALGYGATQGSLISRRTLQKSRRMKERLLFGSSAALQQLFSHLRRSTSKTFRFTEREMKSPLPTSLEHSRGRIWDW